MLDGFRFMERMWALKDSMTWDRNRRHTRVYLGSPPKGKDLHPACLILYYWYSLSCYNGGANEIWPRWKKRRVLAYAHGIYARLDCRPPPWPPLLSLIWWARSRDLVQVDYRCMWTLISLGLLSLRMSILFLGCSRYANVEDPRGGSLVNRSFARA
jgi:hypothetical protein